jgi:DNA topoisomerase IA
MHRVLCVAEKPSIAKSVSNILSGGQYTTVSMLFLCFVRQIIHSRDHPTESDRQAPSTSETMTSSTPRPIHILQ